MSSFRLRHFAAFLIVAGPFSWGIACKKEEPPPTPAAVEEEPAPKKKKKKVEEEETEDTGSGAADPTTTATGAGGTWKAPVKADAGSAKSDADKNKLIACCTALRNTAQAAGVASAAASAAIPGMPPPPPSPPKEELDKAVKECDKAVANWNGDLNTSLKGVKGATAVALPSACMITG